MNKAEAERVSDAVWLEDHFWDARDVKRVEFLQVGPIDREDYDVIVHFNSGAYMRVSDREGGGQVA
jgi:hypothetical protein